MRSFTPLRPILALLLLLLLCSCPRQGERPLRLGLLVWPPYEMFYLAQELGYLKDAGVEIIDYRTPSEAIRAYQNGLLDAVGLTNHLFLSLYERDPDQRIIMLINQSLGADALVARPEFGQVSALKGKRVGAESSALGAYVLLRALELNGLRLEDVEYVPVDVANQRQAYLEGRVDAVTTYEPFRTHLLQEGAVELFNSRSIPGEITDVLVTRRDLIEGHPRQLEKLVAGWFAAVAQFRQAPLEAAARVSHRENLGAEEFLQALNGIELLGWGENRAALADGSPVFAESLQQVAQRMQELKIIADLPPLGQAIDARFIQASPP